MRNVSEPIRASQIEIASEEVWAAYNAKMTDLFAERDRWPVSSPQREAAALAILALWVSQG
jgi:hypothetical protein